MQAYFITFFFCSTIILAFDSIGAIASRKLDFNYGLLLPASLVLYLGVGMYTTVTINQMAGITITGLVGIVESIWGLKLAKHFQANWGNMDIEMMSEEMNNPIVIITMSVFCMFIGWLGSIMV